MATIKKKGAKKAKAKPRSVVGEEVPAQKDRLELRTLQRELADALARENATSEILRMIARVPADIQSVMDTIAESAARLCDADDALVRRLEGDRYYTVSHFGSVPIVSPIGVSGPLDRSTPHGRAVVDRETVHVHDLRAAADEYPGARAHGLTVGVRTALATPLLLNGQPIGCIHIRRTEVRPFTDAQIKLLETFADQAVIAIENARLFQEREAGNRDLAALHDVTDRRQPVLGDQAGLGRSDEKDNGDFRFRRVRIFLFDPQTRETLN